MNEPLKEKRIILTFIIGLISIIGTVILLH